MLLRTLLVAVGAVLAAHGATGSLRPQCGGALPGQDPNAAATCGMCHRETHAEWQKSAHARAWTDPIYQKALKGKDRPQLCHSCHIPGSVLERLGQKPHVRELQLDDGVGCSSCHQRGEALHGPFELHTDAHPSEQDPAFTGQGSVALCSSCHDLRIADVLPVAKDFARSTLPEQGRTCVGCHMPAVERQLAVSPATGKLQGETRKGRSHELRGPADAEFCAKAFELELEQKGDKLVVHLRNTAGHGVPGYVGRTFPVLLVLVDNKGSPLRDHKLLLSSDNPLLVEEDRQIELPAPANAVAVEVQIDHLFGGKLVATVCKRRLERK